jgi:hypothetical protein
MFNIPTVSTAWLAHCAVAGKQQQQQQQLSLLNCLFQSLKNSTTQQLQALGICAAHSSELSQHM